MLRINLALLLLLLHLVPAFGQEFVPNRFYMFNLKTVNPALTAKDGRQHLTLMGMGLVPDNPNYSINSSNLISYEKYFSKINSGIGLQFNNVTAFPSDKTAGLFYRYGIKLSENSRLSIGTAIKVSSVRALHTDMYGNPLGDKSYIAPDFDLGAAYQYKTLYVGISLNHLTGPKFPLGYGYNYQYNPLLNICLGNQFKIAKWLNVEPMFLYRQTSTTYSFNEKALNIQIRFIDRIIAGGGYSITNYNTFYPTEIHRYYANVGVVAFKKLELVSLVYSGGKYKGAKTPIADHAFNYEFLVRVKF